ncbi:MAG: hypothetical protein V1758_13975, partial [Pseudomonadota bacterium]
MADGNWPILFNTLALLFAGVGAGIGKDPREGQRLPDELKGLLKFADRDQGNVPLGIHMERAGGAAGRDAPLFDSVGARH